jgi:hypothetical protein
MPRSDITVKFQLGKEDHVAAKATFIPGETWEEWTIRVTKMLGDSK